MDIDGIHIDIERKPIKHLHIAVYPPDARVRVSAPKHLSQTDIERFVLQKLAWIRRSRTKVLARPRPTIHHYLSGETHYIFGECVLLQVVSTSACRPSVIRVDDKLILHVCPNTTESRRAALIKEYRRALLYEYLTKAVAHWQTVMGEPDVTWSIRQMRSEWGSCTPRKRKLLFNLELSRVPASCIDYIIVHELSHLRVPNHSRLFEIRVEQFIPDWRTRRQHLNDFITVSSSC